MKKVLNKEIEWYDNPNLITSLIIGLIGLIIILSQSFAIHNNLSAISILSNILNHNSIYLFIGAYFIALKTRIGKKYFDFLNLFLIIIHTLTAVTSFLTIFQSFGLSSLVGLSIDVLILIYLVHTLLRSTNIWKGANLGNSPFNEITNDGYFYTIFILSITLLAVNLISTTSFDGTILTLMECLFTLLFIRYIFLYGAFLDSKEISVNNEGNFDKYREAFKEEVANFEERVVDLVDDAREMAEDIKEDIVEKIEESELDEKIDDVKEMVTELTEKVTDKAKDIKEDIVEKVEKVSLDIKKKKNEMISDKNVSIKKNAPKKGDK